MSITSVLVQFYVWKGLVPSLLDARPNVVWNIGPFRCGLCMWDYVACVEGSVSAEFIGLLSDGKETVSSA
jgi:hypothetical protein